MLRRIGLTNFKCFDALDLPCAPLNLLCGLNGMGKSSVIQALLVLRQSFRGGHLQEGRLVLGGALTDLGAGSDVLFEDADDEVVGFVLHGDQPQPQSNGSRTCPVTGQPVKRGKVFAGGGKDATAKSILNRLLSEELEKEELGVLVKDPKAFQRAAAAARKAGVRKVLKPSQYFFGSMVEAAWAGAFRSSRFGDQLTAVSPVDVRGTIPTGLFASSDAVRQEKGIPPVWREVPPFGGRLVYVEAERIGPRKWYPLSEIMAHVREFGARGEYAWNYLNDKQNELFDAGDPRCRDQRRLLDVVDHWLQYVSPGVHLQIRSVSDADAVVAGFTFDRPGDVASRRHRATNVGFGLSYVLPVVLALLSQRGTLCLIENPEAHLHPRGQTRLAELAARAAAAGVQVFVETHSDHFLDGVRLAIHDGLIPPADVAIHYFEREGGRAVVSSPNVDADGRLSRWPAGFFDQHEENLARLLAPRS